LTYNEKIYQSETDYKVIESQNNYSVVLVKLLTGRKHQIRKHFSMIGHPILGDKRFGLKDNSNFFLHSYYTEFKSEKKILIKLIAPIPDYFKEAISRMNVNFDKIEDKIKILL
jgi:23S rRNA-/tRNA-specific pseudouridylate synthase